MSGESVRVAIRVRPYNSRERSEGAELCVEMKGKMTKVWNKETNYVKEFFFDHSYWSHDGFIEQAGGLMVKDGPYSIYADQQNVFDDLGNDVLNNAWNGYHTCLFAYGQTGSGKSYSMVGYGANKGIVPIACEEIFKRISSANNPNVKYDVKVSMLEIYNEQVQDLLTPPAKRVQGGLKIRENPKTGVYVEGIVFNAVNSYDEINGVIETGNKHRTVAATQMNATSSRAHTVLTISFTQIFYEEGTGKPLNRKQSDINLVDLAGSERAAKTGATGDRLQEGSNINKSLSTLGKVITALAKKSAGKAGKGEVVPYRESKLTRILQNALGGNSKTTMIAAISPATFNFEETLSTLRYADAVKSIKNQAIVNETPQEKLIRELREENERLKNMIEGRGGGAPIDDETRREFELQIEELRRAKEDAEKTYQDKLRDVEFARSTTVTVVKKEITGPHFMNINEDPQLTGHIKHEIPAGTIHIGRAPGTNQIVLQGLGVAENHCQLTHSGGVVSLMPSSDSNGKTMINGQPVVTNTQLNHGDRVRFGNYLYFLFVDPKISSSPEVDWHAAVTEANENEMKSMMGEKEAELKLKEAEMQQKMQAEWKEAQKQIEEERKKLNVLLEAKQKQDAESIKALAEREAALIARQSEMEEELKRKGQELKIKEKERQSRSRLEQVVSNSLQISNEANERASMLGKSLRLRPEFTRKQNPDGSLATGPDSINMRYRLMFPGLNDVRLFWPSSVLEERIPDMADMCQQYFEGTPIEDIDIGYDPFSIDPDSIESMLDVDGNIGQVSLITETLYYLMEVPEEPHAIYNTQGQQVGSLIASIYPRMEGVVIEEEDFESMKDIEGQSLYLDVAIQSARNLPASLSKDVYCSYSLPFIGREVFNTHRATGEGAVFNYKNEHSFIVTKLTSHEMEKGQLIINVFGSKPESMRLQEINTVRKAIGLAPTNASISSSSLSIDDKKLSQPHSVSKASDLQVTHEEKKSYETAPAAKPKDMPAPAKKTAQEAPSNASNRVVPDAKPEREHDRFKSNPSVYSLDPKAVPSSDSTSVKNSSIVSLTPVSESTEVKVLEPVKVEVAPEAKKSSCCIII